VSSGNKGSEVIIYRNLVRLTLLIVLGLLARPYNAIAEDKISSPKEESVLVGKFVVLFESIEKGKSWMAKAYQGSVEEYIGGFQNLNVVYLQEDEQQRVQKKCGNSGANFTNCVSQLFDSLKTDFNFLFIGVLEGATVQYRVIEKQSKVTFLDGEIDVKGISAVNLQVASLQVIKPFVKPGGLIDQVLAEDKKLLTLDIPQFLQPIIPKWSVGVASSVLPLFGGICWGALILLIARFCVGSLHGVDRIASTAVSKFLRSWFEIFLLKFAGALLLLAPSAFIGFFMQKAGLVTFKFFWLFLFPTIGLLTIALLLVVSWMIAEVLERLYLKKVNVAAWNDKIKKYYFSYATKLGVDFPESLINRIRFTAGNTQKVICVGGGLIETTVIIPKGIAVLALDEIDMTGEEAEGRDPRMPSEMRSIITPQTLSADKFVRNSEDSFDNFEKDRRKILVGKGEEASLDGDDQNKLEVKREINQEAGVWGYVLPRAKDKSIPLISDTSDDLEVVDELIREHHVQYYKPQMEENFDDLDTGNRDFLFGILVQKVAMIDRWEHVMCNIHHVLNNFMDGTKGIVSLLPRLVRGFYQTNLSGYYSRLSDHYVIFNQAHHHLIQYYYFTLKGRKRELTQRAPHDKLVHTTNKIAAWLSNNPAELNEDSKEQLELRNRLVELVHFANAGVDLTIETRIFPWRKIGIASAGVVAISLQTTQALEFAPVYKQRQSDLAEKIKEYEEKDSERKDSLDKVQNPKVSEAAAEQVEENKVKQVEAAKPSEPKEKTSKVSSKKNSKKSQATKDVKSKKKNNSKSRKGER
jgi:hypothetical protein